MQNRYRRKRAITSLDERQSPATDEGEAPLNCHNRMLCCKRRRSRVQRNVTARFESFGEADADLAALNPGIRPDLLLIKQVDQVSALNGRLPPAGGAPGPSPHRRDDIFGAGADARGPGAVTVVETGEEAHAFHAVHPISLNSERFRPPRLWKAIGTGIGTLTPTTSTRMLLANLRAASPSRVKIAVPLPYSFPLMSLVAGSSPVMTIFAGSD